MASHYQHGADVLPFPVKDYPEGPRFVRPIPDEHIARAHEPVDLVELYRESLNRQAEFDKDLSIIGWGLAAAYLWVCFFRIAQMIGVLP